ncbi:hypothetical protein ACFFV7_20405 [Nonomuraea spiralis]|uniref:Uncharacterized protein n=1 Tax=Nonomuraea spiralis TaxID=46182 RepID=A0ABV5IG93_9ACTN|nr:hypothetical protein [Nonomuraea spiralis]GGS99346.1 hypothetical protein GCM10010176_049220 [Nonomuraea spiralis]
MNPTWRSGTVELLDGYTLTDSEGRRTSTVHGVRFAIEGGYLNVEVPGVPHVQIVSAPAVRLVTCDSVLTS